jgi:hypothetical protein
MVLSFVEVRRSRQYKCTQTDDCAHAKFPVPAATEYTTCARHHGGQVHTLCDLVHIHVAHIWNKIYTPHSVYDVHIHSPHALDTMHTMCTRVAVYCFPPLTPGNTGGTWLFAHVHIHVAHNSNQIYTPNSVYCVHIHTPHDSDTMYTLCTRVAVYCFPPLTPGNTGGICACTSAISAKGSFLRSEESRLINQDRRRAQHQAIESWTLFLLVDVQTTSGMVVASKGWYMVHSLGADCGCLCACYCCVNACKQVGSPLIHHIAISDHAWLNIS